MTKTRTPLWAILASALSLSVCFSQESPAPDSIVILSQGHRLKGRFFPAMADSPRATLILLQGFPGNERDVLGLGEKLSQSGMNVLMFNYSGTHRSEGKFNFTSTLDDIRAAYDYLSGPAQRKRPGVDPRTILLAGYSYGGGMALTYAASHPEIRRVISIAGNDHGAFAREYRRNSEMAHVLDSVFDALRSPAGPIQFDGKEVLKQLAANPDPYDLRLSAPRLADRDILLAGGWDDWQVSIEDNLLPLYRALKKSGSTTVRFITFHTDHSFREVRAELAAELARWINSSASPPTK